MIPIVAGWAPFRNSRFWALVVCLAGLGASCDKVPLLAPQKSTITISSSTTVVQANGTAEIRATVLEQTGTPVQNGTTVTFSTNLGTLSPSESRTLNGVATVQFVAGGQSGKAQIKALSGGAASEAIELSVGAAAAGRVSIVASPTSVPATGGTSSVTATVMDASGNALRGVAVAFTTSAGTLSATTVDSDASGAAATTLTTTREATVTAAVGGLPPVTVVVGVVARPTVSISVATGSTPTEGGVTTFSIAASPATGGSPIQKVTVSYDDGSSDDLGSVSGTIAVQHVYGSSGSFAPKATAQDAAGGSASASTVIFVQPLLVSVSAAKAGNTATFTAAVSPTGTAIASYAWNFGDGSTQTTSANTASHTYAPGTYTVRVTARTSTGYTTSSTTAVSIP